MRLDANVEYNKRPSSARRRTSSGESVNSMDEQNMSLTRKIMDFLTASRVAFWAVMMAMAVSDVMYWISCCIMPTKKFPAFDPDNYTYTRPDMSARPKPKRSPCPALNMLANHGYLPHNGQDISRTKMIQALQSGFNLSYPLAWFITTGGYLLTGQFRLMSLRDLRRHNGIEHNASLFHADVAEGEEYAPWQFEPKMLESAVSDAENLRHPKALTLHSIAASRVRREGETSVDSLHAEIARGEIGLVLDIFGGRQRRLDVCQLREMLSQEQFPTGWFPRRKQTLAQTILTSQTMKRHMQAISDGDDIVDEQVSDNFIQKALKLYIAIFQDRGVRR